MNGNLADAVENAHIKELQRQVAALEADNRKLASEVARIPQIILEARLDAKQGKSTQYSAPASNWLRMVR